jgi:2-methylcitrate dehydratase PrpD
MSSDAIYQITDHILQTKYEDIPNETREVAKKLFLDTIGAIIAGSTAPGCDTVVKLVKNWRGKRESTIAAYGGKVPAYNAVWANSTMARSREIDAQCDIAGEHPNVSAYPAALAMSELLGKINGKDVITAVTLASDFTLRLRTAGHLRPGVSPWTTGSYAPYVSAIVAGRLMKLNREQFLDALGLAYTQFSNTVQQHLEGTLSTRVHHGMNARNGILAALLASNGITGPHNILEGKFGYYPVFMQNKYDRETLLSGLGKEYFNVRLGIKPFSSCAATHQPIEATLQLVQKYDLHPDDITEITVHTNQSSFNICALPPEIKKAPQTVVHAQFSFHYTVACAVVYREVYLDQFTPQSIREPAVLDIAKRVTVIVDPTLESEVAVPPSIVEIKTRSGKTYSTRVDYVKGNPHNPMSFDECVAKFNKSLAYSVKPIRDSQKIIEMVRHLEDVTDVAEIARLMAG